MPYGATQSILLSTVLPDRPPESVLPCICRELMVFLRPEMAKSSNWRSRGQCVTIRS